jgi:hypothetical protein
VVLIYSNHFLQFSKEKPEGGEGGKMTQTLYAHMNKRKKIKIN